jgi:hypothetical protein
MALAVVSALALHVPEVVVMDDLQSELVSQAVR